MKQTIRIYLNTLLLFMIPFIVIAFILAFISYFIPLNNIFLGILLQVLSYFFLLIASLYFTSQFENKRMNHCFLMSFIYFLGSLFIHLGNLHYIHLCMKSLLFIFVGLFKELKTKKEAKLL